jgi:hypothetical protein
MPSKTRLLANLITNTGDVKSTNLDNVVASGGVDSAGTLSLVGIDGIFREHNSHVTSNITIDSAYNAIAAGPIFIDSGYTITINDSATLVIA